ncbi:hypothetical protein SLS62_004551 [Diatrype stigma]|uniref:ribonuclease T1 n=1 Tax=Diatrype stigma TaxID=117547 RepID=A0AAN9UT42_9PEZI
MAGSKILRVIFLAALSAWSVSAGAVQTREDCVATCGTVCYWQSDIDDAVAAGYKLFKAGDTVGDNDYPHAFDNREGFDIPVDGPWQEFPILSTYKPYTGGAPGADRIVFNEDGDFAISVTHTGASGNNFVACKT